MIPSSWVQVRKARRASSSLQTMYSARPESLSQACSGPTPCNITLVLDLNARLIASTHRVVETSRHRVRLDDLSGRGLQDVGAHAMQHAGLAQGEGCRVPVGVNT